MRTVFDWHDADIERPKETCWCMVISKARLIMEVDYSKKHDAFNASDYLNHSEHKIPVAYWAKTTKTYNEMMESLRGGETE